MYLLRYLILYSAFSICLNFARIAVICKEKIVVRPFYSHISLTDLSKIGIIIFFILALFNIFQKRKNKATIFQVRIRRIVFGLLVINIFSTLLGLYNGFFDKIPSDIFNSISGLTVAYAVAGLKIDHNKLGVFFREFSLVVTTFFVLSLVAMEIGLYFERIQYLALVPSGLVLSYFYFGGKEKGGKKGKIFIFVLILLSLKRSIILSFVVTWLFCLFNCNTKWRAWKYSGSILGLGLFICIIFSVGKIGTSVKIPFIHGTIKKINKVNPLSEEFRFSKGSGGDRVAEVMSVFKAFKENNYNWIIGAGNGFTYQRDYGKFRDLKVLHNVHFTPLALISRYGVFVSLVILILLLKYLSWVVLIYQGAPQYVKGLLFYQIFGFLVSLFSYAIATDFILWITMGLLLAYQSNKNLSYEF